jgi:hypothetical protein
MDKHGKQPLVFSLLTEVPKVLATMDKTATLRQFAEVFGRRICMRLRKATRLTPPPTPTATCISLLGYYNETPGIAIVEIRSANRFEYDVDPENVLYNVINGCFPGEILKRFYVDPVFERFRARDCPHSGIQAA